MGNESSKSVEATKQTMPYEAKWDAKCPELTLGDVTIRFKYTPKPSGAKFSVTVETNNESFVVRSDNGILTQDGIFVDKTKRTITFAPRPKQGTSHEPDILTFHLPKVSKNDLQKLIGLGQDVYVGIEEKDLEDTRRDLGLEPPRDAPRGLMKRMSSEKQDSPDDFGLPEVPEVINQRWVAPPLRPYDSSAKLIPKVRSGIQSGMGPPQHVEDADSDAHAPEALSDDSLTDTVLYDISESPRRLASTSNTMDDTFTLLMVLPFILILVLLFKRIAESYSKKDDVVADNDGLNQDDALHNIV